MFSFNKEELLKSIGCEDVKSYMLVNNYGYTFVKSGFKFDLRHWLNCYGADVDYWLLDGYNQVTKQYASLDGSSYKHFDKFEDAFEFLKLYMKGGE